MQVYTVHTAKLNGILPVVPGTQPLAICQGIVQVAFLQKLHY